MPIVRLALTLLLVPAFLAAFLAWLLAGSLSRQLLDADFYLDAAREVDLYERLYDERILEDELGKSARDVTGGVTVSRRDMVAVVRRIAPPEYVQAETERAVRRFLAYLQNRGDDPGLTLDLSQPIDNIEPVVTEYVLERIEKLPTRPAGSRDEFIRSLEQAMANLQRGRLPESLLTHPLSPAEAQAAVTSLPRPLADLDEEGRRQLEEALVAGDTQRLLSIAAPFVLRPVIHQSIERLQDEIGGDGTVLDPLGRAAAAEGVSREEYLERLETPRSAVTRAKRVAQPLALAVMAVVAALLVAVQLPNLRRGLLSLGLTAATSGGLVMMLIVAFGLLAPQRIAAAMDPGSSATVASLTSVLTDLWQNVAEGIAWQWLPRALAVLGGGLVLALLSRLVPST